MASVEEIVKTVNDLNEAEKNQVLLEVISKSSVLWLKDFVKAFEEKFEVTAMAPVMAASAGMGVPAGAPAPAEAAEEKTTFDVILKDVGPNKINTIKAVRALTNLGLKEAKTLVDTAPQAVKTGIPKEEAQKMLKELETAGAKVELK